MPVEQNAFAVHDGACKRHTLRMNRGRLRKEASISMILLGQLPINLNTNRQVFGWCNTMTFVLFMMGRSRSLSLAVVVDK